MACNKMASNVCFFPKPFLRNENLGLFEGSCYTHNKCPPAEPRIADKKHLSHVLGFNWHSNETIL